MLKSEELKSLPIFNNLSSADLTYLSHHMQKIALPQDHSVFRAGQECGAFIFLIEGSVRVHMTAENGREIVLYRVEEGQTCILTTACLLSQEAYSADAICEAPGEALILNASSFNELIGMSAAFRKQVFENYAHRLCTLMGLIEEIAFGKMDHRLAHFLMKNMPSQGPLVITHSELATELGTAREVVSRLLKDFEKRNWIELKRGQIVMRNAQAFLELANSPV